MTKKARELIVDIVNAKPGISVGDVAVHLYRSLDHETASYTWMINAAVNEGLVERGEEGDGEKLYPAGHDQAKQ